MDNKLSELSKPVATVDVQRGRPDGNMFSVAWGSAGHALPDGPHFIYSQEYVSALLAELEASKKSNAFLKEQLAKLANFNPDWDMLEACRESWREVAAALKEAEAKLATPVRLSASTVMSRRYVVAAIEAAGFTVGDE